MQYSSQKLFESDELEIDSELLNRWNTYTQFNLPNMKPADFKFNPKQKILNLKKIIFKN